MTLAHLSNGTGHITSLRVTLNNLLDIAASMAAFVVAAWVGAAFHSLFSIPA